jgi:outer membrane protein TolC
VEGSWLKTLSDPQVQAVVEEVLRNNLGLRLAATRVEVAAGIPRWVGITPELSGEPNLVRNHGGSVSEGLE